MEASVNWKGVCSFASGFPCTQMTENRSGYAGASKKLYELIIFVVLVAINMISLYRSQHVSVSVLHAYENVSKLRDWQAG